MDNQNQDLPENQEISIELTEDMAEGVYSNLAIITHSHTEFVLDFVRLMPGVPKAKVKSRVILTPEHAKQLLKALQENIQRFEGQNGAINSRDIPFPLNFGGAKGEA
ncbi:DUF3467 domain-containing protein [Sphingobacterium lactis]|uniref:DUF3467 domain-containing protein n=1 Tax=Sphingobacterium kyonggiense TaxID=714075 RepID=A0ABP7YIA0_9SPHI